MEAVLERSLPANLIKIADLDESSLIEANKKQENSSKLSSSANKDDPAADQEGLLKSAKAEMGEIREENQKLKLMLTKILKDYNSLQLHFHDIVHPEEPKNFEDTDSTHQEYEESNELVCLSLGRFPNVMKEKKRAAKSSEDKEDDKFGEGFALGLDCGYDPSLLESKNSSPANSLNETKEEEPTDKWPPSKSLKMMRDGDNDVLQQNPLKKARVSVRAHCNTPTMNDGCHWRKYGQKIAKGNPCPRAYYRCTGSTSCPVRKQVQRCAEDMSILTTTYEGSHDHPLSVSATAIASTTSAAVSILRSASSSSQPGLGATATTTTSTTANLHGPNFSFTNSNTNSVTHPTYFPKASISTSQSHPTITIDLTNPPASSEFNRLSSSWLSAPRYPSTCLKFSSSSNSSLGLNSSQNSWPGGYLSYGTQTNNKYLGKKHSHQENFYQPYMLQKSHSTTTTTTTTTTSQPPLMSDTIVAATKAITWKPNFQSVLTAAIKSFVGNNGSNQSGQNVKWGDQSFPLSSTLAFPPTQNGIGCATSNLNRLPSLNSQQGNLTLFAPSLPLSTSKGANSVPSSEKGEHIKSDRPFG